MVSNCASFERLGDAAFAYVAVVNSSQTRQTGHTIDDFTVKLYDPNDTDITSTVNISVLEFEAGGSPTGAYRFSVGLPANGDEGAYTFKVTDPLGRVYTSAFMAYSVLYGDAGDGTAQIKLRIRNIDGSVPESVAIEDLTLRIYNPDMEEVSSTLSPALTELEDGLFLLEFDIGSGDAGYWFVDVIDDTRFPQGKLAVWTYRPATSDGGGRTRMQPEEALYSILMDESTVTDLIGARAYPSHAGYKATYPLVLYTRITSEYLETLDGLAALGLAHVGLQLDIFGTGYSTAKNVARVIRAALNNYSGTVMGDTSSLTVRTIRHASERDDPENPEEGRAYAIYRVTQEYDFWFYNQ